MARPDLSKRSIILGTNFFDNEENAAPKKGKMKTKSFFAKQQEGLWDEFTPKDWVDYFCSKASENGFTYIRGDYMKEIGIMKGLMNKFTYTDIRDIIDFVWDAPHKIMDKSTMGVWILSANWLNTVYNSMLKWRNGESLTPNAPADKREWIPEEKTEKGYKITI